MHTMDLPSVMDKEESQGRAPIPNPSEEAGGPVVSGFTPLISHTHVLTVGHISRADPTVGFCFGGVGHPVKAAVGRQEGGLAGRTFCSFMCFASFFVMGPAGPLATVGVGPPVLAELQRPAS